MLMVVFLYNILYNLIGEYMEKKKIFKMLIVLIISIAIVMLITTFLLDTTGKINQGNFRVNDVVIESKLDILQKQEIEVSELSNMLLDISQTNTLSLLIASNVDIKEANITNIEIDLPVKLGSMFIEQSGQEKIYNLTDDTVVNIYPEEKDEQYSIDLNIVNENCLTDVNVPSNTNVVTFDGTILELLNQKYEDFVFNISFDLNIYDIAGNKNTCKIKLKLPDEEMYVNGINIKRDDLSNYVFRLK